MNDNACLRPACLSDVATVCGDLVMSKTQDESIYQSYLAGNALKDLYDTEWRKRGFERSP